VRSLIAKFILIICACKTPGTAHDSAIYSNPVDFNASGKDLFEIEPHYPSAGFCYKNYDFNIRNAYWMGVLSALVYYKSSVLEAELSKIYNALLAKTQNMGKEEFANMTHPPKPFTTTYIADKETDTEAVWIESGSVAWLIFRGTSTKLDAKIDASILKQKFLSGAGGKGWVHRGFNNALNSVWPQVDKQLSKFKIKQAANPNSALYIGGHSLGGALATLATARITVQRQRGGYRYNINVHGLYTYGSPRVGTREFVDHYFQTTRTRKAENLTTYSVVRVRNTADIVTRIPPRKLNYKHFGRAMYLTRDGEFYSQYLHRNLGLLWIPGDIEADANIELALKSVLIGDYHLGTDHLMANYLEKLKRELARAYKVAENKGTDICDPYLYKDEKNSVKKSRMVFSLFNKNHVVRFEVKNDPSSNALLFDVFYNHGKDMDLKGQKFVHKSALFNQRALLIKTKWGDFDFYFDSIKGGSQNNNPSVRDGCGVTFIPNEKYNGGDENSRQGLQMRESETSCTTNLSRAAYAAGSWKGANRARNTQK
jgi:triacylglycerol lipase